jgi:hypothetical protein
MRRVLLVSAVVCAAVSAPATLDAQPSATPRVVIEVPRQGPPLPPRDTSARPTMPTPVVGTATLTGRVVSADTGEPLRRATVSAMSTRPPAPTGNGRGFVPPRPFSARTDDEGRFAIRELPAGEYNVTARRAGYVDQSFGQTTPTTPARRVQVGEGAAVGPLDFRLVRGGVVTGRVVDEQGEPAERVQVRTVRSQRAGGQTRWIGFSAGDATDDQGHYRLFGLPPGEYLVLAEPGDRRYMGSQNVQGVDTDTISTYGPGTVNPAEAVKVVVQPGVEAAMDIQLVAAKVATVRGRVVTSKGEPMSSGFVNLQPDGDFMGMGKGGPVMGDGRFEIDAVAPGTYTVFAQDMSRGGFNDDGPPPEAASQTITVEGEDVDVSLTMSPGSTASGRVIVEGGNPVEIANRNLRLMSFPVQAAGMRSPPGRGKVAADLTFEMHGLRGRQVLNAQMLPEGYWLKDVRVSGQSALDGFDFGNGRAFPNVEVVISARPTGLTGSVTMPTGGAAGDYAVVLFPQDEEKWERGPIGGHGPRVVRPDLDGTFKLPSLRPGSYFVLAVPAEQADMQALSEPDQLRMLTGRARTVDVEEGQMANVTLTLVER